MRIEEEIKLDYTDVLFRPKRSTLKSRKEVEDKAIGIIRSKYQQLYENDEKFQTIAQGHVATIESLINQMY